jgi:integrase
MTKRINPNKLTIYRRHAETCKATNMSSCECPLWVHGRVRGKFIRMSLDTRSLATAEAKRRELLTRGTDPEPDGPGGIHLVGGQPRDQITVTAAEAAFLAAKSNKGSATINLYSLVIGHFRRHMEAHGVTILTHVSFEHIRQYFAEYTSWSPRTARTYLDVLRTFFNYCVAPSRRWIDFSPAADRELSFGKTKAAARLPFTPEEVTRILAAIEQVDKSERDRARALILLLLYSGVRISDATFFERSYINERSIADFFVIKTRRPINCPIKLQPPATDALNALPPSRVYFFQPDSDGDYLAARQALRNGEEFRRAMPDYEARVRETTDLVKKVLRLAGITEGACHRFRDTFAINMLLGSGKNGTDILTVSEMLGHSDVRITQRHYLKLIPGYRERMSQATQVLAYQFPFAG